MRVFKCSQIEKDDHSRLELGQIDGLHGPCHPVWEIFGNLGQGGQMRDRTGY